MWLTIIIAMRMSRHMAIAFQGTVAVTLSGLRRAIDFTAESTLPLMALAASCF